MAGLFGNPAIQPLSVKGVTAEMVTETWIAWKRALEYWFGAVDIIDGDKKFSCLMAYGGIELQKIYASFPEEEIVGLFVTATPQDKYTNAIRKLDDYFSPKYHELFYRHKFWQVSKESDETIDDIVLKIREAASHCTFGRNEIESCEIAMMHKLMMMVSQDQRERLLQKPDLTFEGAIQIIKAQEAAKFEARQLSERPRSFGINRLIQTSSCKNCGRRGHERGSSRCAAKNVKCFNCEDIGHFANCCKKPLKQPRNTRDRYEKRTYEEPERKRTYDEPERKRRKMEVRNVS